MTHTMVAFPVPGQDCAEIAMCVFERPGDDQQFSAATWARNTAPCNVEDEDLLWFHQARTIPEALGLAFGTQWRIDALPSTRPDGSSSFLLTERQFGWRLLCHFRPKGKGWCTDVHEPRGALSGDDPARDVAVAGLRREWLASAATDTSACASLWKMLTRLSRKSRDAVKADDRAAATLLVETLTEVWLAEQGYTGADAQAIRTMVGLSGLHALKSYDRTTPPSRRRGARAGGRR